MVKKELITGMRRILLKAFSKKLKKINIPIIEVILFSGIFILFYFIIYFVSNDITKHVQLIQKVLDGTRDPPGVFLYFLTVYIFSLFQNDTDFLLLSSAIVLSLAVTAKYIITNKILHCYLSINETNNLINRLIILFSILLLFVFSLPTSSNPWGKYFLGQIPPNVWHNSTTIFLMPFALILFWLSYLQLLKPKKSRVFLILLFCALNVFIKPSFFFVFSIAYPLLLFKNFRLKKNFWVNIIPVIIGFFLLLTVYFLIYKLNHVSANPRESGVTISLFTVWSHRTPYIHLSLLASLIFPLVYIMVYPREIRKNLLLQYSTLGYLIAIIIKSVFSETGSRQFHGNFGWQCVIASYILFLVISSLTINNLLKTGLKYWRNIILLIAFCVHAISGIIYIIKMFVSGTFR
ncbi:hypothetical protein ACFLS9_09815 [Bacteroidota bacterium]